MARITLDIPDAMLARVVASLGAVHGGKDAGENDADFLQRRLKDFMRRTIVQHESRQQIENTRRTVESEVRL